MGNPSAKKLSLLGINESAAKELKTLLDSFDPCEPETVNKVLDKANELMEGSGVEAIQNEKFWSRYYTNINLLYVNTGDTYYPTLVYDTHRQRFQVISWGDWIEIAERNGRYKSPA